MKLTSDNETLAENKVLILYVLNTLNKPITNDALYTIVNSAIDMNYFYFQQFLLDLIESKYIINYDQETQTVYEITDSGKNTLNLTLDILPGIVKLNVDTNLKSKLECLENEQSIVAEFTPKNENEFEVECKIIENGEITFEIKTYAYTRKQAQKIVDHWKEQASTLYPKFLNMLTNNEK